MRASFSIGGRRLFLGLGVGLMLGLMLGLMIGLMLRLGVGWGVVSSEGIFSAGQQSPTSNKAAHKDAVYKHISYRPLSWPEFLKDAVKDAPKEVRKDAHNEGQAAALQQALVRSCHTLLKKPPQTPFFSERGAVRASAAIKSPNNAHPHTAFHTVKADAQGAEVAHKPATVRAWWPFCRALENLKNKADVSAHLLIKKYLQPYVLKKERQISRPDKSHALSAIISPLISLLNGIKSDPNERAKTQGLFTGYYAPVVPGNLFKTDVYNVPLHGRPKDMLVADLGQFDPTLKGKKLVGRAEKGKLVPYHDRAAIAAGALGTATKNFPNSTNQTQAPKEKHGQEQNNQPILWLKSPIDKFFLQIQGSGRVRLPKSQINKSQIIDAPLGARAPDMETNTAANLDESSVFVGYAGNNGHPYTAIGRYLIEQGHMALADVSMASIRKWLRAHPKKMTNVLYQNKRYIFMQKRDKGPYGTQGALLTPERSLAVDRRVVPLGTPVFLDTTTSATGKPFKKYMVAQDTGGAIKGAIRGDIYFGHGKKAAVLAGGQKSKGRLFLLLPKQISVTNNQAMTPKKSDTL